MRVRYPNRAHNKVCEEFRFGGLPSDHQATLTISFIRTSLSRWHDFQPAVKLPTVTRARWYFAGGLFTAVQSLPFCCTGGRRRRLDLALSGRSPKPAAKSSSSARVWSAAFVFFTVLLALHSTRADVPRISRPVVKTRMGEIRGRVDGGVCEFLGIPYAAPPVGDLRWSAPQPHPSWTGALDATKPGNWCAHCF